MAPGYASLSSVASHALGCSVTSWTAEPGGVSFSVERLRSAYVGSMHAARMMVPK